MMSKYKSIFISDIHLGSRGSKAKLLYKFLDYIEDDVGTDNLFIVGDLIDIWALKRKWKFPKSHSNIVRKLLGMAKRGIHVTYLPGNHDETFKEFSGNKFGKIKIKNFCTYKSVNKKRYYVCHGDEFDIFMTPKFSWISHLGGGIYERILWMNQILNWWRKKTGGKYWSLSKYVKRKAKIASNVISKYENALINSGEKKGYDGVICGHIHHAENKLINDFHYLNSGDWVDSCTALGEDFDGNWHIIDWGHKIFKNKL